MILVEIIIVAGPDVSENLEIWSNATGTFLYYSGVTKTELIAGYTFNSPAGATLSTDYQIRDSGTCAIVYTLVNITGNCTITGVIECNP